jgi:hypothetical protein
MKEKDYKPCKRPLGNAIDDAGRVISYLLCNAGNNSCHTMHNAEVLDDADQNQDTVAGIDFYSYERKTDWMG